MIYTSEGNAYLHLPGVIVAESSTGETRYLLGDGLGSVRQAVDETGAVVAYNEFDPYGNPVQQGSEPYGFTGEWWQEEAELLHLRARWYAPYLNQLISPDPIIPDYYNPQSLNQYSYVQNNPVNRIDPTGLSWQFPTGSEGVAIHILVENDYRLRAEALGRVVGTEVEIAGASKEDSDFWWEGELAQRIPLPDINDPQPGHADIVDFTLRSVYDIKHYPSRVMGFADAIWYRDHLNADPNYRDFGPWKTGGPEGYPGPFLIGDWPTDPDAYLFASYTMPGAITYWGVAKPKKVLEWCLTAAAILILHKAPSKVPIPGGIRPIPVPVPSGPLPVPTP